MSERKLVFLMKPEQALRFAGLLEAGESGDGAAACTLGDMYRVGSDGLRASPKQAFRWYSRAALAGDPEGQNNLGACFEHGLGCQQSYAKAVKWYRLSAAKQVGTASMNLGYCYLRGKGMPQDRREALRLLRLAVRQGEPKAAEELEQLGEPLEEPQFTTTVEFKDMTQNGVHFGLTVAPPSASGGEDDGHEPQPKKHVPLDKEWLFDNLATARVEPVSEESSVRDQSPTAERPCS